jgi:predicted kinase
VLTGIPGSGKTTLATTRFPNHTRINLDTLKTRHQERLRILEAIQNFQDIIIDNTNTSVKSRKMYIELARKFGAKVRSIYVSCPLDVALARNADRIGWERVPDFVLKIYNKRLEPPKLEEGFDSVEIQVSS